MPSFKALPWQHARFLFINITREQVHMHLQCLKRSMSSKPEDFEDIDEQHPTLSAHGDLCAVNETGTELPLGHQLEAFQAAYAQDNYRYTGGMEHDDMINRRNNVE
ncbi:hypothetical protein LEN26_017549 [Aphanomyces euteiches]|nr:hypothetical protein LEN26_017549 [Aphanomyces euteiches]